MYEIQLLEFFHQHRNNKTNIYQKCILIDFDNIIGDFDQIHKLCHVYEKSIKRSMSKRNIQNY